MRTLVIDHPLVAHKLTRLRREETSSATFRLLAEELVTLLAYEATNSLGMLNGMMKLMPTAEVGFLGMVRDETSLLATTYADRLPHDLHDRQVFVLDPMLATGGTLVAAISLLLDRGARDVTAICLLAAPEGLRHMEEAFAGRDVEVTVVTAALDERLNEKGYIVPVLGDAGDRLYGVV
jgi:uracil phosphoribosyltransferase